ncbi:hypothetical protein Tco_0679288 [Tanacetum coccineum]|uniref:Uncharacterized protein n=1 Tax=Tanacetum coccineum TaxID=301880 RepID=A0ABQ4XHN9_9ASTR
MRTVKDDELLSKLVEALDSSLNDDSFKSGMLRTVSKVERGLRCQMISTRSNLMRTLLGMLKGMILLVEGCGGGGLSSTAMGADPTHSGYFKRSPSDIEDTEYVATRQPPSFTPGGTTSFTGDGQRGLEPVDEHTESPSISSVHPGGGQDQVHAKAPGVSSAGGHDIHLIPIKHGSLLIARLVGSVWMEEI